MGRVHTTGLGKHFAAVGLHLPSWSDEVDEMSPGVPLYGPSSGVPWQARMYVYGIESGARTDPPWDGLTRAYMPPPWDNESLTNEDVGEALYEVFPVWRRLIPLESLVVSSMEFTVWETTAPAAMWTGGLLGPSWMPSDELIDRAPRSAEDLNSSIWVMP